MFPRMQLGLLLLLTCATDSACSALVMLINQKCSDLTPLVLIIKSAAGISKSIFFSFFFFSSTTCSCQPRINPRVKLLGRRSGQQMFDSCFQQLSLHTRFYFKHRPSGFGMASVHPAFFFFFLFLFLLPAGCLLSRCCQTLIRSPTLPPRTSPSSSPACCASTSPPSSFPSLPFVRASFSLCLVAPFFFFLPSPLLPAAASCFHTDRYAQHMLPLTLSITFLRTCVYVERRKERGA